ncbi:hypothetical protein ZIOFF_068713 [Zingiber officinale]|uniref:Uncharacterized protein n=1 Tax=Zingiber officinale TaxID=94328 RepID=A0A8J5CHV1_ZINOF|nr:hypothetical protein ZIOFF_068713 [Zingiber officinale]
MTSSVETESQRSLIRVPEPKSFGGTRSAKELENFLWDMEQYFVVAKVPETKKEIIASMYLIGDAKLWWRTRLVDDANAGRQKIDTWDRLKKEMKDQFLPGNTSWIARDGLKQFEDVMPSEIPKCLPPRRNIDHKIELILGVVPPVSLSYHMSPLELAELRHMVINCHVRMDPKKVLAIVEWQHPSTIPELRSFLGVANYYRKFIVGYSKKAAPLTDLLKKNLRGNVHTDASDRAIGGVLVQEGHPVAFESKKLNAAEQKYSTHEKEMVAVVHCLQHKPGRHNQVADALSRKEVFATFYSISRVESDMLDRIKAVTASDTTYEKLVQQVKDMENDVEAYVKTCLVCQQDKTEGKKEAGLLQPLPIPEKPWVSVSMDFISGFPKVDDMSSIMVVVDRFSTYAIFIVAPSACPSDVAAELFYRHVVKFFGLLNDIVSDRGTQHAECQGTKNFLWDMEQYFVAAKVPETEKEIIASMYLIGDAKLWWRTRMVDDANVELHRQNMKDLPCAIVAADALVDLRTSKENLNTSSSSKSNFIRKDKKGDWKKEFKKDDKKKDSGNNHGKGKAEHSVARGKDNLKNQGYFLCNDPHFAKDCPKREKLNALQLGDKGEDYEQEVATLVNPLQLLNTIVDYESIELLTNMSEDMVRAHSLLLHIFVMMNGKSANAMVDIGATHTFVSVKLVEDYGLSICKCPRYFKSVNAKAQAVVGMTYNAPLTVGTWVGKANMMVIPLEDFQIILKKGKTNIISAISLQKGLRRGESTYLAALIDAKPDQNVELPVGVQDILSKFKDMVLDRLRKHQLFVKKEKCEFASQEVMFLGHMVINCHVRMDPKKVLAIVEWQHPSTIPELHSFLGVANYYHKFIIGYSKKAAPLTDLLKKNVRWEWSDACKDAVGKNGERRRSLRQNLSCVPTRQDRKKKEEGLLQPLPIPEKPWVSVSMTFISGFLKVDGMSSIMVVVDGFSKYAIFIAAPSACPSDVATKLFYRHVIKFFGLPNDIVSDRDTRFTGRFWTTLFNMMGTDLKFSTANHPQTDGQTERINYVLEEYLWHYVTASQKNWLGLLDSAQFCYNLHKSSATKMSPFEIVLGEQPTTPMEIAKQKYGGKCPAAYRYAREKQELLEEAQGSLRKAARRMKKYADKKRRPLEFSVGGEVLLKLTPQIWKRISSKNAHRGLIAKYDRPFKIVEKVGNVAYRLNLPERLKVHPTFHVSFLKKFHADDMDPSRSYAKRAPSVVRKQFSDDVVEILNHRTFGMSKKNRIIEFLVLWKGKPKSEATWERDVTL